jgi:AcrR family transcriptional regulator
MELFGRQGYRATTIAQIEAAAGLSAGAGGLYRHFRSKRELLEEGLRRQAEAGRPLIAYLDDPRLAELPRRERFLAVARAGLRRLGEERDVNRLLLRDLAAFPDLLEQVRTQELKRVHDAVTVFLRREIPEYGDHEALAAVLLAAVSHYWIFNDIFDGRHPHEVDADRFLGALADLVVTNTRGADHCPAPAGGEG